MWLLFGSILAAYFIAVRRHERATGEVDAATRPSGSSCSACAILWLAADWPIHDLAEHYLFSMHMVQHMLFTLVAAPLLIAGMPGWLLRASSCAQGRSTRSSAFMTRPLVALIFFNAAALHPLARRRGGVAWLGALPLPRCTS